MDKWNRVTAKLCEYGIRYTENKKLARHSTFKIGGCARLYCEVENKDELCRLIMLLKENNIRFFILGKGSNVLFADEGFSGTVIRLIGTLCNISVNGTELQAGAGADVSDICIAARNAALEGLSFAYGIPGSVGGAVFMNAGAYCGEMSDIVSCVEIMDENCNIKTLSADILQFGYRKSAFQYNKWIVLNVIFTLKIGNKNEIDAKMKELAKCRADKQPLDMPSAGSTFKRPDGAYAAALIDKCGLRGYSIGGAAISEKHCGFVVNTGTATCADVLALADEVCRLVQEKTGYKLEKEIRVVK